MHLAKSAPLASSNNLFACLGPPNHLNTLLSLHRVDPTHFGQTGPTHFSAEAPAEKILAAGRRPLIRPELACQIWCRSDQNCGSSCVARRQTDGRTDGHSFAPL